MSGRPCQDWAMAQGLVPLGQAPGGLFICSSTDPLSVADDDAISVCKETNKTSGCWAEGTYPRSRRAGQRSPDGPAVDEG